jgi:hypothetical protein
MLSARKRKKLLYSGSNAPLMYAVLDSALKQYMVPAYQDYALEKLKETLSRPENMAVLTRLKDK